MSLLVVDDNLVNLKLVSGLVRKTGRECDSVQSGAEAVSAHERSPYSLILMDRLMPEMSGEEAMHAIRKLDLEKNRYTKIVCLTAADEDDLEERLLKEGFDAFLSKPVTLDTLSGTIARLEAQDTACGAEEQNPPCGMEEQRDACDCEEQAVEIPEYLSEYPLKFIDLGQALSGCGGDAEALTDVFDIILKYSEEKLLALYDFLHAGDIKNYEIEVHSLKSNAATVGAGAVRDLAAALEAAASRGDRGFLTENHKQFVKNYSILMSELEKLREFIREQKKAERANEALEYKGTLTASDSELVQTFSQIRSCISTGDYAGASDLIGLLPMFDCPAEISELSDRLGDAFFEGNYEEALHLADLLMKQS